MLLAAIRVRLAIVLLGVALLLVTAAVIACLVALHDPVLAAILAVAGGAGVLGGAFAHAVSREVDAPAEPEVEAVAPPAAQAIVASREAPRVQSLPVAHLPPAYLAAVMKGVQANRAAQQARVLPGAGLRH